MRPEYRGSQPPFELLELGSHTRPFPTGATTGRPPVVVRPRAAEVDHAVDTAGATEDATTRHDMNAIHRTGLRRGNVLPVDVGAPQRKILAGDSNRLPVVAAAGFEQ